METKIVSPFDMSLRFWSDTVPFDDLAGRLHLPVHRLDAKGRPMSGNAAVAGRLATRHFATLAHGKGTTFSEVTEWLRRTVRHVEADAALVRLMETGKVEALFWIAMFGRDPVQTPPLDADLVSSIASVHSRVLIENYTPVSPDYPTKAWFPERPE